MLGRWGAWGERVRRVGAGGLVGWGRSRVCDDVASVPGTVPQEAQAQPGLEAVVDVMSLPGWVPKTMFPVI